MTRQNLFVIALSNLTALVIGAFCSTTTKRAMNARGEFWWLPAGALLIIANLIYRDRFDDTTLVVVMLLNFFVGLLFMVFAHLGEQIGGIILLPIQGLLDKSRGKSDGSHRWM